jgi:hypothetical protein
MLQHTPRRQHSGSAFRTQDCHQRHACSAQSAHHRLPAAQAALAGAWPPPVLQLFIIATTRLHARTSASLGITRC